jgi:H+/gluconate symporter-like permease
MSGRDPRADSLWSRLVRCLVLTIPLAIMTLVMRVCGVPVAVIVAVLVLIPVAAAFIPRAAARWRPWGSALCFVCPINAMLAVFGPDDPPMSSMIVAGLAAGIAAMLLEILTGRIARRSAPAS